MKKWMVRILVTLNILILIAGVGAWLNKEVFLRLFVAELYAIRMSFFESYPLQSDDVVMLGDSITEGGEWNEMFPGMSIRNRGIGGDNTTGVLARLDAIVAARPRAIFLKLGTNDLTLGPDLEVSHRQYREILETIQAKSPDTTLYVQSLLPREAEMRAEVESYNRVIRAMADELGIPFVNLYPEFLAPDGSIRDELTYDELHLTGEGYRLWQSLLLPSMAAYQIR